MHVDIGCSCMKSVYVIMRFQLINDVYVFLHFLIIIDLCDYSHFLKKYLIPRHILPTFAFASWWFSQILWFYVETNKL